MLLPIQSEYTNFGGQVVTEYGSGPVTDYVYANGQKVAAVDSIRPVMSFQGDRTNAPHLEYGIEGAVGGVPANITGLVIQQGDQLVHDIQQTSVPTYGGIALLLARPDSSFDYTGDAADATTGMPLFFDSFTDGQWHHFDGDLSGHAGETVTNLELGIHNTAPAAPFDLQVANVAIVRADGTFLPIFNGQSTTLAYLGGVTDGASNPTFGTVFAPATGTPIATTYYLVDHLGSTQMEFAQGGWPVWQGQFAPYGQQLDSEVTHNHFKFTGKQRDAESGLDYSGARYYSSNQGRFASPDPSGLSYADPTNPQSLNLYAYALNNPLKLIDPSGLTACFAGGVGDTTENDSDASDYYQTENVDECTASGGVSINSDTSVNVSANGTGSDVTNLDVGGSSRLIDAGTFGQDKQNISLCAAKYGSAHSVASLLGVGNNYAANLFGGNSVSGLVNLGNSIFGGGGPPDLANMALGGASLGIPVNNIRTFTGGGSITGLNGATGYVRGQALQGVFNAATESGAIPSIAVEGGELAVQGGLTAGEFASGVGIAKFVLDAATFGAGLVSCTSK